MADVISMNDFKYPWKEEFSVDGPNSTLQVYVNARTGEAEIVQMNDTDEVIRTQVSKSDCYQLTTVLGRLSVKKRQ